MYTRLKLILLLVALLVQGGFYFNQYSTDIMLIPAAFTMFAVIMAVVEIWLVVPGFLLSTFCIITSWRLSSLAGDSNILYIMLPLFLLTLWQFKSLACQSIAALKNTNSRGSCSLFEWQSIFIRLFMGYDLIPHFSEKLFAGDMVRAGDIKAFTALGISDPFNFVIAAGIIEFLGSLSLSCGILTRLGSFCLVIYLLVATTMGHHFQLGFIWANPGGGWEYPVLWSSLIFTYAIVGANSFSVDNFISKYVKLPHFVTKYLMGNKE